MIYAMFLGGLIGLFLGGEFLVRGSVGIARRLCIPPLVIGLTIVGFGTSTPELLVSVQAALSGVPDLAIGNVIGSNIANILLILGLTAIIQPVPITFSETKRDFIAMLGATLLLWAMLLGGRIAGWQGGILVLLLLLYVFVSLKTARSEPETVETGPMRPGWQSLLLAIGGLLVLMAGARLLVESATEIARTFGISEAVIGLTIVAVGTSLPELATSALAALRGHSAIAVGNILGSNMFNILGILGVTALVAPIPVDPRFAHVDIAIAFAAAVAMLGFALAGGRVGRLGGGALLAAYAGYLGFVA